MKSNLAIDQKRDDAVSRRFAELDVVALRESCAVPENVTLPSGALGTIVGVWASGRGYEVEFTQPVAALVTLRPRQIRRAAAA